MRAAIARLRAAPHGSLPGYRPGATAARVLGDLRATRDGANGAARLPNGMRIAIAEQVARQFLMHTVSVRIDVTSAGPAACGSAQLAQTGWLRHTGVRAVLRPGCDAAFATSAAALAADPSLRDTLCPLHLTDCTIAARDGRWTLSLVPFGGSEVVNRMPSFRRYVRLTGEQAGALAAACEAFERALRGILRG